MNKLFIYGIAFLFMLNGCATMDQTSKTIVATQTGSAIGSLFGFVIGDNLGGRHGSFVGSTIGSVAGTAVCALVVAPRGNEREKRVYEIPAFPAPYLVITDIILDDENSNEGIDAGEKCKLTFVILNDGNASAHNVTPIITKRKGCSHLRISDPMVIERIDSGETLRYVVYISASRSIKTGIADLEIVLEEGNGFDTTGEVFSVRTKAALR
ncbi:MAG: hypothetical protein PHQ68_03160 [Parabacteroides sp.]|nr:hypothetical protein [Parabacteroides sp.]